MAYDIIIKNGLVFDGTGNPPRKIDIGIKGEKINEIDDLQNEIAVETIDATGKHVCPGFIDLTTHSDNHWTLFNNPMQESFLRQGITTILGGNCGFSLAPLMGGRGIKNLEISRVNINWQSISELFDEIERYKLGLNFATLTGFNTLYYDVVGGDTDLLPQEILKQMKFLLVKSMEEGSFGLSTNFSITQAGSLEDDMLIEIFKTVAKENGLTKHHLEDEGRDVLPAISRLINFSRKSRAKLHISHIKLLGKMSWQFFDPAREMIKNARNEGVLVTSDFFPYERTGSNLFSLLPLWARKLNMDTIIEIINSPKDSRRKEIIYSLKELTLHYDRIIVASSLRESCNVGKTIAEISESIGLPPEEVILNLLSSNNLHVSIFSKVISEKHLVELSKEDFTAISSDGIGYDESSFLSGSIISKEGLRDLPHPRSFGAFPRAIRMFVKESKVLSWEKIIYKMTGLPASILGIGDRGIIKKKNKADVVIISPDKVSDHSTYENPFQFSSGVESVIVNGSVVLREGNLTGNFPGEVLRKK